MIMDLNVKSTTGLSHSALFISYATQIYPTSKSSPSILPAWPGLA